MCLYVTETSLDPLLDSGERVARKSHRCHECRRVIDPGERYRYWTGVDPMETGAVVTEKMCAHCWGTIELGAAITGCPKTWWWGEVHDHHDENMGFVANIIHDDGHDLAPAQVITMLRTVAGRRRQWRWRDGSLMDVPAVPA